MSQVQNQSQATYVEGVNSLNSLGQHCPSNCSYQLIQNHHFVWGWWTNSHDLSSTYFSGCRLLFQGERVRGPLQVFNNSSSVEFKARSLPAKSCNLATTTYYRTDQSSQPWKQLQTGEQTFKIRKDNRARFLEVCL